MALVWISEKMVPDKMRKISQNETDLTHITVYQRQKPNLCVSLLSDIM